jgi:protein TonB
MRLSSLQPWSDSNDAAALRRSAILLLVAALHILLLIMLLRLAPPPVPPRVTPPVLTMVKLLPDAPERTRGAKAKREQGRVARRAVAPPSAPVPPAAPSSSAIWSQVIPVTREQFAAADISKMPSPPTAQDGDDTGRSDTAAGEDSAGVGKGPNGQPLYDAEWYRRPTRAELGFYLPPGTAQTGWGMIACQTAPDYRVENCTEIAQSPAASGLARAVRQAAWQFRVLPPRKGGRSMVGAWVRIRIDYTVSGPA